MRLCFGTFARVLRVCRKASVNDPLLVSAMTKTIDPDCRYSEVKNKQAVSRLLNCSGEFPTSEITTGSGASEDSVNDETASKVAMLAYAVSTTDLVPKFANSVLNLLDEDKKIAAVIVLLEIITADPTLDSKNKMKFEKCLGASKGQICSKTEFVLSEFLAGLFLYTVVLVDNRFEEKFVDTIDDEVTPTKRPRRYTFADSFTKIIEERGDSITVVDTREPEPFHFNNAWNAECGDEICAEVLDRIEKPDGERGIRIGQQNIKSKVINNFF